MLTTIDLIVLTAGSGQLWPVSRAALPLPDDLSPKTAAAVAIDEIWGWDRLVALVECGWRHTPDSLTLALVALLDALAVSPTVRPIGSQTDAAKLAALLVVAARHSTDPHLRAASVRHGWPADLLDPRAWLEPGHTASAQRSQQ